MRCHMASSLALPKHAAPRRAASSAETAHVLVFWVAVAVDSEATVGIYTAGETCGASWLVNCVCEESVCLSSAEREGEDCTHTKLASVLSHLAVVTRLNRPVYFNIDKNFNNHDNLVYDDDDVYLVKLALLLTHTTDSRLRQSRPRVVNTVLCVVARQ